MVFAPTMVKALILNIFPTPMMPMCRTWAPHLLLISSLALPTLTNKFEESYVYNKSSFFFLGVLGTLRMTIHSAISCDVINPGVSMSELTS
jgi:hypothetical protein